MIYKHSALQDMLLNYCLSSIGSPRRYMYPLHEKDMSDYISTKSGIHHQLRIFYKGANSLSCGDLLVASRFNG